MCHLCVSCEASPPLVWNKSLIFPFCFSQLHSGYRAEAGREKQNHKQTSEDTWEKSRTLWQAWFSLFIARWGEEGSWSGCPCSLSFSSSKYCWINTHMNTNLSTQQFLLQHLCSHLSSYAQMSTFVSLHPCLSPPCLFLLFICFHAMYLFRGSAPAYSPSPSCLYSPHSQFASYSILRLPLPHHPLPAQILNIFFSTLSASLLCSFILFFSPLSAWGSSGDIITPTVTMVSGKGTLITGSNREAHCCSIFYTHTRAHTRRQSKMRRLWDVQRNTLYYRIQTVCVCVCGVRSVLMTGLCEWTGRRRTGPHPGRSPLLWSR